MKQAFTTKYVSDFYDSKDWTLLDVYVRSNFKLNSLCPEGHLNNQSFNDFKQGRRCRTCQYINISGPNHYRWNLDRTRDIRSGYLRKTNKTLIKLLKDDYNYINYINYPKEYNIDHIFPRIAFIDNDLDNIYGLEVCKTISNLKENLKIISSKDNGSKGGKYNQEEFMNWFNDKIKEYKL